MKQGSLLSPVLFNIFLDDLLLELKNTDTGIRIDDLLLNTCAYADDVTIFSSTIPGLQQLINISAAYAKKWRFSFSTKKTKCIVLGTMLTSKAPTWYLNDHPVHCSEEVDILGITFQSNKKSDAHINNRVSACRKSVFALASAGMSYPGLNSDIKAYIWKTIGIPTLSYGMDCLPLTEKDINRMSSVCTSHVKSILGIPKRSHHSAVMEALNIPSMSKVIQRAKAGLWHRIFQVDSPVRELQARLLSRYLLCGSCENGTFISSLVSSAMNPLSIIFDKTVIKNIISYESDGVVDSLRYLLVHENYIKPWSDEYVLVSLLTKAF